jgi:diguanylate cyclase (GGDEF)-like protein
MHKHRRFVGVLVFGIAVAIAAFQTNAADAPRWTRLATRVFQNFPANSGLPHPVVTSVAQDGRGFLWVGTEDGLARWDGYRFHAYRHDPDDPASLPADAIQTLHVDQVGRLWIGMSSGELARYDDDRDAFVSFHPQGDRGRLTVWSIADDARGGVWVGAESGLERIDLRDAISQMAGGGSSGATGLPDAPIRAVMRDDSGSLWIGTPVGLFHDAKGDLRFHRIVFPADSQDVDVTRVFEDGAGRIWVGSGNKGAFVVRPGAGAAQPVGSPERSEILTGEHAITAIAEVRTGEIWLGGIGIISVDAETGAIEPIRRNPAIRSSLANDVVFDIFRDRSGQVWVANEQGLSRYDATQTAVLSVFADPNQPSALPIDDILSVLSTADGRIWLGSRAYGVEILDPATGRSQLIKPDSSDPERRLPRTQVRALAAGPDGAVYIGTNKGLYRSNASGEVSRVTLAQRAPDSPVAALLVDHGALWIGGADDGLWRADIAPAGLAASSSQSQIEDLKGYHIYSLATDGDALWVGTSNGLFHVDAASQTSVRFPTGDSDHDRLCDGLISAMARDGRGRLWVGVFGGGIVVIEGRDAGGRFRTRVIDTPQGLPADTVDMLVADRQGGFWVSTDGGLAVIDPNSLTVRPALRVDGVQMSAFIVGSGAADRDGEIVFGASGGLAVVRPVLFKDWRYNPPLVITEAAIGGAPIPVGRFSRADSRNPVIVPAEANKLAVEFSALDFTAPDRNRYAYTLEGYDKNWIGTDASHRIASYANLPYGDYVLRLRGSNRDGVWKKDELAIPIRVLPAWNQTLWFRIGAGMAVIAVLGGFTRGYTAYFRRRQTVLEQSVADRTADLVERTTELSRSNAALAQSAETLRELGAIGQEIASSLDVETLCFSLSRHAGVLLDAARFALFLSNPATGSLTLEFAMEQGMRIRPGTRLADDPAQYAKIAAAERRQLVVAMDPAAGFRMPSLLVAPLIVDTRVLGALTIQSSRPNAYGEREEVIARTLSAYGAIALTNAQTLTALRRTQSLLEEFAYLDPLTSLANRRSFLATFRRAMAEARERRSGFALLLIDMDRLKSTNDTMGHDAGDALLVEAAARLKESIRDSDKIARIGGDEFAIILTATDRVLVDGICQRLVDSFKFPLAYKGAMLTTSPSIGIALFPDDAQSEEKLYKLADLALFEAKRAGRNTWRRFHPDMAAA